MPDQYLLNRTKLERLVAEYKTSGNIPNDVQDNFHRYDPALIHKLHSAEYNLERLNEKLTTTDIQEAANMTGDFMFEINMYIDGFFYNSGSALDILARVVLTLFGEPLTGNIYFETAHTVLSKNSPGDPILQRLKKPTWRQEFSDYRNSSTHELILASRYHIEIEITGATPTQRIVFPLPDDPRSAITNRTFRRNPNVQEYTTTHFKRILRTANTIYGEIATRAKTSGHLPL